MGKEGHPANPSPFHIYQVDLTCLCSCTVELCPLGRLIYGLCAWQGLNNEDDEAVTRSWVKTALEMAFFLPLSLPSLCASLKYV